MSWDDSDSDDDGTCWSLAVVREPEQAAQTLAAPATWVPDETESSAVAARVSDSGSAPAAKPDDFSNAGSTETSSGPQSENGVLKASAAPPKAAVRARVLSLSKLGKAAASRAAAAVASSAVAATGRLRKSSSGSRSSLDSVLAKDAEADDVTQSTVVEQQVSTTAVDQQPTSKSLMREVVAASAPSSCESSSLPEVAPSPLAPAVEWAALVRAAELRWGIALGLLRDELEGGASCDTAVLEAARAAAGPDEMALLAAISLGPKRDVDVLHRQILKDLRRESFVVNGAEFGPERFSETIDCIETSLAPSVSTARALEHRLQRVMRVCSRTISGFDSFETLSQLLACGAGVRGTPPPVITPDPRDYNPIVVELQGNKLRVTTTEFFRLSPTMEDVENRRKGNMVCASVTEEIALDSWQGTRTLGLFPLDEGAS